MPVEVDHVWGWYLALEAARSGSGFGPNPIGYAEMQAWSSMTGARPTPFEVECLRAVDAAYFAALAKNRAKSKGR